MYAGFHSGVLTGARTGLTFQATTGVQFSRLSLGAGFGFERHDLGTFSPVTANVAYRLQKDNFTPYLAISTGYMAGLNRSVYTVHNGFTTGIFTGAEHRLTTHLTIFAAIGYRYIQLSSRFETFAPEKLIYQLHRCELRIGLNFS